MSTPLWSLLWSLSFAGHSDMWQCGCDTVGNTAAVIRGSSRHWMTLPTRYGNIAWAKHCYSVFEQQNNRWHVCQQSTEQWLLGHPHLTDSLTEHQQGQCCASTSLVLELTPDTDAFDDAKFAILYIYNYIKKLALTYITLKNYNFFEISQVAGDRHTYVYTVNYFCLF